MKFGKSKSYGTGSLISGKHILTCAHNCYDRDLKKEANEILFIPGLNGKSGKQFKVIKISYLSQYKTVNQNDQKYDYAILQLQKDISEHYGYLGMDFMWSQKQYKNKQITICGYPSDKAGNQEKTMWTMSGKINQTNQNIIYYDIITESGNSGSPIFYKQNNNYFIIGVHTHANNFKKMNGGGIIKKQQMKKINNQIVKVTGILNLRANNIESEGMKHLAEASKNFSNLTHLDLQYNNIESEGMKHLAEASKNFSNLTHLYLWNNNIGSEGMKHLAEASKNFSNLTQLNLGWNNINEQQIKKLMKDVKFKIRY